ncbi:MAG: hypothetical protein JST51_10685 [Armatimonadetes bacterium]|nr:hypothetical protein [Armatimonadota bacterium]
MQRSGKVLLSLVASAVILILVEYGSAKANASESLSLYEAQAKMPRGFQSLAPLSNTAASVTFVSDHELVAHRNSVIVRPTGISTTGPIDDVGITAFYGGQGGDRQCKGIGRNLLKVDLNGSIESKWDCDESYPASPFLPSRYIIPGHLANLFDSDCGPFKMSLDGNLKVAEPDHPWQYKGLYWEPIHEFINPYFTSDGSRSKIEVLESDSQDDNTTLPVDSLSDYRWIVSMLGVCFDKRLIFSWTNSSSKTGICFGRLVDGHVVIEDVSDLAFNLGNPCAISLDGRLMAFTRTDNSANPAKPSDIVLRSLESGAETVIGHYDGTFIKNMMISPKNSFIVLELPTSVVYRKLPTT